MKTLYKYGLIFNNTSSWICQNSIEIFKFYAIFFYIYKKITGHTIFRLTSIGYDMVIEVNWTNWDK